MAAVELFKHTSTIPNLDPLMLRSHLLTFAFPNLNAMDLDWAEDIVSRIRRNRTKPLG